MKNYLIHKRLLAVPDRFRPHLDSSVAHSFRHMDLYIYIYIYMVGN